MRENSRLHKRRNDPGFTRDGQASFSSGFSVSASTSANSRIMRTKGRTSSRTARLGPRGPHATGLIPPADTPKIARGTGAEVADLDAILAIVPDSPAKSLFEQLPE